MQERQRSQAAATFLVIGLAFLAIGASRGQRVFLTVGLVFLVLGAVRMIRG